VEPRSPDRLEEGQVAVVTVVDEVVDEEVAVQKAMMLDRVAVRTPVAAGADQVDEAESNSSSNLSLTK
jgi:hypothetical protein